MQKSQESISDEFKRKIGRFTKSGAYLNYCEEVYGYREYLFNMMDREQIDFLLQNIPVSPDDVILDLGCGSGSILNLLCKKYGCRGVGIDTLDPEMFRGNPNLVNYLCGDIDRLQEYGLEQTITLSVDSLYFSGDLEKLLLSFVTKRNSRLYFFYSQYLLGEGTVSRDSLKEDRTKVGEILNRYATSYRTIDFSMNEKCLYERSLRILERLESDFEREGNRDLLEEKRKDDLFGRMLYEKGLAARYLYRIE